MSYSSACEVEYQLSIARRLGYDTNAQQTNSNELDFPTIETIETRAATVCRMLASLVQHHTTET